MAGSARWFGSVGTAAMAVVLSISFVSVVQRPVEAQKPRRVNRLIEMLETGKPAFTGDSWIFVDREHRPYDVTELRQTLNTMFANKNAQGQPILAPIVRVPTEGDQDVRWVIKQVLESGAMGIIVPQVDTGAQALKIVQSMRYPQLKDSKYPNPPGRRGCGCSGGSAWGLQNPADYVRVADAWPLNPEGELVSFPMIESPEGVRNVNAILDVPGVTGVLVGPTDLTMNHGEGRWNGPSPTPDTHAAIARVAAACTAKKKTCAMVTANEAETKKYLDAGFKIIFGTYLKNSSS
jgi:4-hydroxy-2-oxoheptanedioate aldolase